MITIPTSKPAIIKALESDFGSTVAESIWRKVIQHINWMNAQFPVGLVMWFYQTTTTDQFGNPSPSLLRVPAPNDTWQFCNGASVSNVNSPLFGQNVPDLRGWFPKGLPTGNTIGQTGGADSFTLAHNHGGTGLALDGDFSAPRTDNSNEVRGYNFHSHPIATHSISVSRTPLYLELQPFMRVV